MLGFKLKKVARASSGVEMNNYNQQAVALFNKLANSYAERFMDVNHYSEGFDFFLEQLSENASVLDVACGPGNICRYLLNRRADLSIHGIEMAPNMIALAKSNNPTATFSQHDAKEIGSIDGIFDAIVVGFLFPYFDQETVIQFLEDASTKLTENGTIYISTIEDHYENSSLQASSTGEYLMQYFYTGDWLKQQLEAIGFSILKEDRVRYPGKDDKEVVDVISIARKKV